jgi:hypothetical protein
MGGDAFNFTGNDRGWAYFFDRILSYMHANLGGGISGTGTDNHLMKWDVSNNAQDSGIVLSDGDDLSGLRDVTFADDEITSDIRAGYPTTSDTAGRNIRISGGDASEQAGSLQRAGGYVTILGGSGPFGGAIPNKIGRGGYVDIEGGYGGFNTDSGDAGDGGPVYIFGGDKGLAGIGADGDYGRVEIGTFNTSEVQIGDDGIPTTIYGEVYFRDFGSLASFIDMTDGENSPVSLASHGRIRYNESTNKFQYSEDGNAWADCFGGGGGAWTSLAGALYPTTGTDDVIIGGTATVGTERLRVVGDSLFDGNLEWNAGYPTTRYLRPVNTPADTNGTWIGIYAGDGEFGFLNDGGNINIVAGRGGDDSSWDGAEGGDTNIYAGTGGDTTNATRPGGFGGNINIVGGYGGDASGTGDGGDGGDAWVTGGVGKLPSGSGDRGDGGPAGISGGPGLFGGPATVFGGSGYETGDGGPVDVEGGRVFGSGTQGTVDIGTNITYTSAVSVAAAGNALGFHGAAAVALQTIVGAKGGNVALTNLLAALATKGLIIDSTT